MLGSKKVKGFKLTREEKAAVKRVRFVTESGHTKAIGSPEDIRVVGEAQTRLRETQEHNQRLMLDRFKR